MWKLLCKPVTFKFWITLEFSRCHGNLKPKRFGLRIEYEPIDRTCQFHYHWQDIFSLLEEIGIGSSVAFLKSFSILLITPEHQTFLNDNIP